MLKHMVSEKDAADEAEMTDILDDAKSECQKHGEVRPPVSRMAVAHPAASSLNRTVSAWPLTHLRCPVHPQCSILSPKPGAAGPPGSAIDGPAIALKVFVRFPTASAALSCGKELHGKQFDGRTVEGSFVSEETFEQLKGLPCYSA